MMRDDSHLIELARWQARHALHDTVAPLGPEATRALETEEAQVATNDAVSALLQLRNAVRRSRARSGRRWT